MPAASLIIWAAVILAAISGKLISGSGMIQTIAVYMVRVGFTGRLFTSAAFLLTCLLSFSAGTQDAELGSVVKTRVKYSVPAVIIALCLLRKHLIPFVNFYAIAMAVVLIASVVTGYGHRSGIDD